MLALTGCQKGRTYFPKDLKPQELDIVRFDNALMNVHEATVAQDIRVLYDEYPVFMPLWVEDILGIPLWIQGHQRPGANGFCRHQRHTNRYFSGFYAHSVSLSRDGDPYPVSVYFGF